MNTKTPSLLDAFARLDEPVKQKLSNISSPLHLGLATLILGTEKAQREYLSAEHIVAALESAGVSVKKTQISRAFARAGNKISRKIIDQEPHYKIMTKGCNEIQSLLSQDGSLDVSYVEAGKPRTARKMLNEILSDINGEVYICDPYYGIRSLDTLDMLNKNCKIKFLTYQKGTTENQYTLTGALTDFKRERPSFEIRQLPNSKQLHDRYILCSDYLLILGQGIKDIGNKESFIIKIDVSYAKDLITNIKNGFNDKWNISQPI